MKWLENLPLGVLVQALAPALGRIVLGLAAALIAMLGVAPHLPGELLGECLKLSSSNNPPLVMLASLSAVLAASL